MTTARRGLKVKVMGQANAVGPTSIDDSFFLLICTYGNGSPSKSTPSYSLSQRLYSIHTFNISTKMLPSTVTKKDKQEN